MKSCYEVIKWIEMIQIKKGSIHGTRVIFLVFRGVSLKSYFVVKFDWNKIVGLKKISGEI